MSSVDVIIRLMLSLWRWPKVITLRGLHCIKLPTKFENKIIIIIIIIILALRWHVKDAQMVFLNLVV